MTRSNEKRLKDEASPGSATSQPDKIQIMSDKTPLAVPGGAVSTPTPPRAPLATAENHSRQRSKCLVSFFRPICNFCCVSLSLP
ncbi:hypothetical protein DPMN_098118 [Dreissena polymorpha]|uniref:Uncharacterized protein n=1 Tax=Dreissena polymorpha TaxID=45954 RepID=A0A9D4LCF0_DREPO|nr:hypothetical protein DPMN_098118 [Dreissena polymorpha]